jgi:hypothetical protein
MEGKNITLSLGAEEIEALGKLRHFLPVVSDTEAICYVIKNYAVLDEKKDILEHQYNSLTNQFEAYQRKVSVVLKGMKELVDVFTK